VQIVIYRGVFETRSARVSNVFVPIVYYNFIIIIIIYIYRFNPSAAVAYGAHNEFAANPSKLRPPPTLPPHHPPTTQPPTGTAAAATSAASVGYHQPPTAAVNRWTEFGKPAVASTPTLDFPVPSYFNNSLL